MGAQEQSTAQGVGWGLVSDRSGLVMSYLSRLVLLVWSSLVWSGRRICMSMLCCGTCVNSGVMRPACCAAGSNLLVSPP